MSTNLTLLGQLVSESESETRVGEADEFEKVFA